MSPWGLAGNPALLILPCTSKDRLSNYNSTVQHKGAQVYNGPGGKKDTFYHAVKVLH